jgi:hypothetical protein
MVTVVEVNLNLVNKVHHDDIETLKQVVLPSLQGLSGLLDPSSQKFPFGQGPP